MCSRVTQRKRETEGEGERRRTGIIVSQTLIDREGMSEGWRGDTGCVNEHCIPTLSPVGTVQEALGLWTLALHNSNCKNLSHPDIHIILIPVRS